jgi:hypothetical protein
MERNDPTSRSTSPYFPGRKFFYKYMTSKVARIVLARRKLRWSSPLLFNDPFDVTQELRLNFDEGQLNAALAERVALLIEQGDHSISVRQPKLADLLRVADRPDFWRTMASAFRKGIFPPISGQIQSFAAAKGKWSEMVPTFRILCLSELNDIIPMWLHYADEYRGVVLEFSAADELDSVFLAARPVVYQDTPPAVADADTWASCILGQGGNTYRDILSEYLYVKTKSWSYEQEWRIVSRARPDDNVLFGDYGFYLYDLTGIYFGPKCSDEDRSDLIALLAHGLQHVQAHQAFPDFQQAKLRFLAIKP